MFANIFKNSYKSNENYNFLQGIFLIVTRAKKGITKFIRPLYAKKTVFYSMTLQLESKISTKKIIINTLIFDFKG